MKQHNSTIFFIGKNNSVVVVCRSQIPQNKWIFQQKKIHILAIMVQYDITLCWEYD